MAAELDDPQALRDLTTIYFRGLGTEKDRVDGSGIQPDPEQAVMWLEKLAQKGDPMDQLALAEQYHRMGYEQLNVWANFALRKLENAVKWYEKVLSNEKSNEKQREEGKTRLGWVKERIEAHKSEQKIKLQKGEKANDEPTHWKYAIYSEAVQAVCGFMTSHSLRDKSFSETSTKVTCPTCLARISYRPLTFNPVEDCLIPT
jgi:hypothetical protein